MSEKKKPGSEKHVRSVVRALELLQALNRSPESTVGDLHRHTGLPKSSILRLLRTLEAKGLVARTSSYGCYRLLGSVTSLSGGVLHDSPIVVAAEEALIDFTSREGWPLALGLPDGDAVVVSASTIPYTSLYHVHSSLYMRLNLIDFALGRAYLAHCSSDLRRSLARLAAQRSRREEPLDEEAVELMLEQVRTCGYAIRDPAFEPQSSTIAVPVQVNGRIAASLGMTWLTAAMSPSRAVELYLPRLVLISQEISAAFGGRAREMAPRADVSSRAGVAGLT